MSSCNTPVAGVVAGIAVSLRLAQPEDLPALRDLVRRAVLSLAARDYDPVLLEDALRGPLGLDESLVCDGTYYVAISGDGPDGPIVGAGGWSRRAALHGPLPCADGAVPDEFVDPATGSAKIRGFFVDPAFAGRGVGALILSRCLAEACDAGFRRVELLATLTGERLYARAGFRTVERFDATLPSGRAFPVVRMERELRG